MIFTYATARSLYSSATVTKDLNIKSPVIVYNGTFILNMQTGEVLLSNIFDDIEKNFIVNLLTHYNVYPLVYKYINGVEKVSWLFGKENDGIINYLNLRKNDKRLNPVANNNELYTGNIFYFTCVGEKDELLKIYNHLKENPNYICIIQKELYREEYWCEIMHKNASKSNAVQRLKEILKCDRIISFGDAVNDIQMFRCSDECYAVENAVSELKNIATGIIDNNDQNGVAKWLELNCLI